jgi:hypothetical protein
MALGAAVWKEVRAELTFLLGANSALRRDAGLQLQAFHAADSVTMHLPAQIGDYTVSTRQCDPQLLLAPMAQLFLMLIVC